jgi:hypothetical protein
VEVSQNRPQADREGSRAGLDGVPGSVAAEMARDVRGPGARLTRRAARRVAASLRSPHGGRRRSRAVRGHDRAARPRLHRLPRSRGPRRADGYYPRIAGKPAGYLYNQLLNFRDGRAPTR